MQQPRLIPIEMCQWKNKGCAERGHTIGHAYTKARSPDVCDALSLGGPSCLPLELVTLGYFTMSSEDL